MPLEFVTELPSRKGGAGRKSTVDPMVDQLKENPGVWAVIDGVSKASVPSFNKRHKGTAEFKVRNGKIFARAIVSEETPARATTSGTARRSRSSRSS